MALLRDTNPKMLFRATGGVVVGLTGVLLQLMPLSWGLENFSYDLPFCFRSQLNATNVILIDVNPSSLGNIVRTNGPLRLEDFHPPLRTNWPPDRRIYARLLDLLNPQMPRLVFFDLALATDKPEEDPEFAKAIRKSDRVVLGWTIGGSVQQTDSNAGAAATRYVPPNDTLRAATTNSGLLIVRPRVGIVRRLVMASDDSGNAKEAAILVAARLNGFKGNGSSKLWLNYYGIGYPMDIVPLSEALDPAESSRFRSKAVFIGGASDPLREDEHETPYTRFGGREARGVEVLATSYLNLVQSEALTRMSTFVQAVINASWGVVAIGFFLCFRPKYTLLLAPLVMLAVAGLSFYAQWTWHCWWSWAIAALVQTPIAAGWAAAANRWWPWPPVAFISYRRVEGEGGGYAQAVCSELEHRGYGAICDVKAELTTTAFRPQLLELIDSVPNFILILSRDSLKTDRINNEGDVLRAEIRHALEKGKNIIPVMIGDFKMPSSNQLPEDIRSLPERHAFVRRDENPWLAMDQIRANIRRPSVFALLRCIRKTGSS